jgi:hypothetical protein
MFERYRAAGVAASSMAKTLALFVAAGAPGRAFDLLSVDESGLEFKRRIERIYRWAKGEHGVALFAQLVGRSIGLRRTLP